MRDKLLLPTCADCECQLYFEGRSPQRRNGVLMKPGERYCLGAKKAVRFTAKDPTRYPPTWCPRRKTPCELRIYGFKSIRDEYLHDLLCRDLGRSISPRASHYCVEAECTTELTPKRFWDSLKDHFLSELLPIQIHTHWIVEIDDGLKPVCFYKTEFGFEIAAFFDSARARENTKEDDI